MAYPLLRHLRTSFHECGRVIVLASMFRDSTPYLARYFSQVEALREFIPVHCVLTEGDSADHTYAELKAFAEEGDATVVKADHGGPRFGSTDHPQRWAQIAQTFRAMVSEIVDPPEVFVWVESDLVWSPPTILKLVAASNDYPAVAPMIFHEGTDTFYDTYGFRKDGLFFHHDPPYVPGIDGYTEIDSCGSCFVTHRWDLVKDWDGLWPYHNDVGLWLDPTVKVEHPR